MHPILVVTGHLFSGTITLAIYDDLWISGLTSHHLELKTPMSLVLQTPVGHALQKLSTWESMIQPDPGLSEDYEAWSSWWGSSRPLFLDVGGVLRVKDPPNLFPCSK